VLMFVTDVPMLTTVMYVHRPLIVSGTRCIVYYDDVLFH